MKCLNIIILYDNEKEVIQYIEEVLRIANGLTDIVLVVNRDTDHRAVSIQRRFGKNVRVVDYGQNVGYLNALLKTAKNMDLDAYSFYILSNTDIHYETKDFFQKLTTKDYGAEVGCIAPCVYATKSGSYSNPHYMVRIQKKKLEQLIKLFSYPLLARIYLKAAELKAGKTKSQKKDSCYPYSPHGCYMILTNAFMRSIRGYEYGVKMYSEESAIGELLTRNNFKCYYDSSISVIHDESSVTGKINYKERFSAWKESLEYILQEFY